MRGETPILFRVAALQSKANLNTIGIVPHNRDGEADVDAEADDSVTCPFDSVTCAFDSLTRALQEEPHESKRPNTMIWIDQIQIDNNEHWQQQQ